MKRSNRKIEVHIEKTAIEPNPVTGEAERKVYGKAYVLEWQLSKSIIDHPDEVSGIEFYATKTSFGSSPIEDMDMAFITNREMDVISSLVHSYLYGVEGEPSTAVIWDTNTVTAYHIVKEFTYENIVENGRILVFDTREDAENYLEGMSPEVYGSKRLLIRKVLMLSRNI